MADIKNYTPSDFPALTAFYQNLGSTLPGEKRIGPKTLEQKLARPGYSPEMYLVFVEEEGAVTALLDSLYERYLERLVIDFNWLEGADRDLLFRRLLVHAEKTGRACGARVIQIALSEYEKDFQSYLRSLEFTHVRTFQSMETELSRHITDRGRVSPCGITPMRQGDEVFLAELQNTVFAGEWGFNPNTPEEIGYYLQLTGSRFEDVFFLQCQGIRTGYIWTHLLSGGEKGQAERGRIHMFGIVPSWRGKGKGTHLFLYGVDHLKRKKVRWVELTVDSANKAAVSVYESAGFRTTMKIFWFEKRIRASF